MPPSQPDGGKPGTPPDPTGTALQTITTYLPTEVIVLYTALVAALDKLDIHNALSVQRHWIAFLGFLVFTPVALWVVFAAKLKSANKGLPKWPRYWPRWEMFAATLAFVAWASASPGSPFTAIDWFSTAVGGFAVLLNSTLLTMLAPLFQRPLEKPDPDPTP